MVIVDGMIVTGACAFMGASVNGAFAEITMEGSFCEIALNFVVIVACAKELGLMMGVACGDELDEIVGIEIVVNDGVGEFVEGGIFFVFGTENFLALLGLKFGEMI